MEIVLAAAAIQLAAALREGEAMVSDDYEVDDVSAKFSFQGQRYELTLKKIG